MQPAPAPAPAAQAPAPAPSPGPWRAEGEKKTIFTAIEQQQITSIMEAVKAFNVEVG